MNCNLTNYFEDHPNINVVYSRYLERSSKKWDYGIFGINYLHPFLLKNNNWQSSEIIKTFYHKGNPLAVVLKRHDSKDYEGIRKIEDRDIDAGVELLEQAVQKDSNNIWLYVQLAKAGLIGEDESDFKKYIGEGRKIFPEYEPFFMLEAQYFYNSKRFNKSRETLEKLLEINPFYANALALKSELDRNE